MPKRPSVQTAAPLIPESPTYDKLRKAASVHPSSILRAPGPEAREAFLEDLRTVARLIHGRGAEAGEGAHAPM
ncbi:hypothetical protein [Pyxidicoccus caerfyrddinensis]|uniref:hypothetical protein n=1 Tax=Pyxidicoccus caerfyrddinensis TaxID=2709663 RepID=UPI001F0793B0|nr:hypothetical protein [Pyxidicoccus caerfyrddinensis]